ncbi:MAG: polysaccharide biosynthesis tyrosine autokinase, partial [Anaerolineae bacterium]|nr:polysaccharide biosynthesis tyrosine autokinase [Anaerolineae bacterium]
MFESYRTKSLLMDEGGIDIRHYLYLLWHWAWLILVVTVISAGAAFFISSQMTPVYESSTKLLVMEAPSTKTTDYNSLLASQSLTKTYSDMMMTESVIKEVIKRLNLVIDPKDLTETIDVTPVNNTQLIKITVNDVNPEMAAKIANTIVVVFIDQIETIQSARFSTSRESLKSQLTEMEKQLQEVNRQKASATTQAESDRLETKALQYQQLYATLLTSYEQARLADIQASVNVVQVNVAEPDYIPVRPNILVNTILIGLAGAIVTLIVILTFDALDDTVKTPEELSKKLGIPVLGVIFNHSISNLPVSQIEPRSPVSESFRSIRTNIQFANVDEPLRTLLVTSPCPSEGKTTISANLAVVFAHNGKNVYYIDADLRQPTVHKKMNIPNQNGLSYFILNPETPLKDLTQKSTIPFLNVITCGNIPPNPAELLGSKKMAQVIEKLKSQSDLVIFDAPPVLAVSDPAVLAPAVDGVILVIQPGKTTFTVLI